MRLTPKMANLFTLLATLIVSFLLGELFVRCYHQYYGIPFLQTLSPFLDQELGWLGKKNFGDIKTSKTKIFIVGDSFTDGLGIPEKKMYYEKIRNAFNAELFVYAANGYGTLQELMVIDKYFDEIKPNIVILQVSTNDFINNHLDLERRSYFNSNFGIRPFLTNNKIEYHFPRLGGRFRLVLISYSRLLYYLDELYEQFCYQLALKGFIPTIEKQISKKGSDLGSFRESIVVTEKLFTKIKQRLKGTPLIVFSADSAEPYSSEFVKIFRQLDISFIDTIPARIKQEISSGKPLTLPDKNHWNEEGHALVGLSLIPFLRSFVFTQTSPFISVDEQFN